MRRSKADSWEVYVFVAGRKMGIGDLRSLLKAEKDLTKTLVSVAFIGELRFLTHDYYEQLGFAARKVVNGQAQRVKQIPARVLLVLMVLCAKHNDISEHGFWHCFLAAIGLPNDQTSQAACRARFREARGLLEDLHFPEGGYSCVTPVLYHAVIPLTYIPEITSLLRKLDEEVGWDAIAEMELYQLESHLPTALSRTHASKALCRFVSDVQSRRFATQLVRDFCEAAYLHKAGEFLTTEIEGLLEDYPIQQQIWRELITTQESLTGRFALYSIFAPPSWQWDVKNKELRISIPKQKVVESSRPVELSIRNRSFPISASSNGDAWEVAPTYIPNALVDSSNSASVKIELIGENGRCLRRWFIKPLADSALFFRPNSTYSLGFHVDLEKGLVPGDWFVLLRRGLQIRDSSGDVVPTRRWYPPRGFEEFAAVSVTLQPPLLILSAEGETLDPIPLAVRIHDSLALSGNLLSEADDPGGIPVFMNEPPDIAIPGKNYVDKKGLLLQWRALSDVNGPKSSTINIQKLVNDGIAEWRKSDLKLQVPMSKLLPKGAIGRFRVRLLYGLQSAGYEPAEFFVVPQIHCSPTTQELEEILYTSEGPPSFELESVGCSGISSEKAQVVSSAPGTYRISWSHQEVEFKAALRFQHFSVPLKWYPHVLRASISSTGTPASWTKDQIVLPDYALTFSQLLHVEALPMARFEIYADDVEKETGQFDSDGRIVFPLAVFSEIARTSPRDEISFWIQVVSRNVPYTLPLFKVIKVSSDRQNEGAGALISRIPAGQSVLHPDYGLGVLETFVEKNVDGSAIQTARFQFHRYEPVQFFIPIVRRLPLYWQ